MDGIPARDLHWPALDRYFPAESCNENFSFRRLKMKQIQSILAVFSSILVLAGSPVFLHAAETEASSPSMEARLKKLEDRAAIHDLLIRYGQLLDEEDFVGYSKLFATEGVWEGGIGSAKGPEGILNMLEKVFGRVSRGQYGNSYHVMSDIMIKVDGDKATSRSNWTWIVEGDDGRPVIQRAGHYEDRLVREAGQWKFAHRLTVTSLPPPAKDAEAEVFRKDHRDY